MSREIERERDTPRAAQWAFQTLGKHRNWERRAVGPDQRVEIEIVGAFQ